MTKDNNLLGKFELTGIPPAPRGVPQIEVSFDLDSNGIMNVSAADKSTGKTEKIEIKNDKGRLSSAEIERMVSDAEKYKEDDENTKKRIEAKNELENYIYSIKGTTSEDKVKETLSDEEMETITTNVDNAAEWLDSHQTEDAEVYQGKTKDLQEIISPLMTKLHEAAGSTEGAPGAPAPEGMEEMMKNMGGQEGMAEMMKNMGGQEGMAEMMKNMGGQEGMADMMKNMGGQEGMADTGDGDGDGEQGETQATVEEVD
jgi:hypothetical protein